MGHLREITDDEVSLYIFPECESEFGFMCAESAVFEDFFDTNCITFFIRDFDSDESETRDRRLYTDRFCLECESEIVLEIGYLGQANTLGRPETILYDGRADTLILHLDIDAELEECPLDYQRLLFYLFTRDEILMFDSIEELERWEIPSPKIYIFWSF